MLTLTANAKAPLGARQALLLCDMPLEPTAWEQAEGAVSSAAYHALPLERGDVICSSPRRDPISHMQGSSHGGRGTQGTSS